MFRPTINPFFIIDNTMNKYFISIISLSAFILLFSACSASTGSRYEKDETKRTTEKNESETIKEDFDITPYRTNIEIEESPANKNGVTEAWYEYDTENENQNSKKRIVGTADGFRVLVITTDNINEANSVREEIKSKVPGKETYISFEPPFYKVKIGDFTDITESNNLKFKLNQLGFTEARVVKETVNLFEE